MIVKRGYDKGLDINIVESKTVLQLPLPVALEEKFKKLERAEIYLPCTVAQNSCMLSEPPWTTTQCQCHLLLSLKGPEKQRHNGT